MGDRFLPNKDDRSYVTDVIIVLSKTALKVELASVDICDMASLTHGRAH